MDTSTSLTEICRKGVLWEDYWKKYSSGGNRGRETTKRLAEMKKADFCRNDVLTWYSKYNFQGFFSPSSYWFSLDFSLKTFALANGLELILFSREVVLSMRIFRPSGS